MSVGLVFSTTNGGTAIEDAIDHGDGSNGETLTAQTIYIRHTGTNDITGVKMYIQAFTGTYAGAFTAIDDLAELLAWGDAATSDGFGGFQVNMNATGSFPSTGWPTLASKHPTYGFVCYTGLGDNSSNAVTLAITSGLVTPGVIPAGSSPNVRIQCRVAIPQDEDTVGIRMFDQTFLYTYTS